MKSYFFSSHMRRHPAMFCPQPHHIPCISLTRAPLRRYYRRIYPPESGALAPSIRPPIVLSQTLHARPLCLRFPPSLASEYPQTLAPRQPPGSFLPRQDPPSRQSGGNTSSLSSSPFGLSGAGLQIPKIAVEYSADIHQAAPKNVFVAWVGCDEDSYKRSRFWWDTEGGYGYASTSNHHGQARMEWNSGREASVWERTMVTLVGATPIKCVFFWDLPLSLLAPTFITRRWHRSRRMGFFHEYMMC